MLKFEKYLSNEMNVTSSFFFRIQLKTNSNLKKEFEQYKNNRSDLSVLFLINEAEKEIQKNEQLKSIENLTNTFFNSKIESSETLKLPDFAF